MVQNIAVPLHILAIMDKSLMIQHIDFHRYIDIDIHADVCEYCVFFNQTSLTLQQTST